MKKLTWFIICCDYFLYTLAGFFIISSSYIALFFPALMYYLLAALGITAGAHRLWAHKSYKARAPLRCLLALMNAAAFQVGQYEY